MCVLSALLYDHAFNPFKIKCNNFRYRRNNYQYYLIVQNPKILSNVINLTILR